MDAIETLSALQDRLRQNNFLSWEELEQLLVICKHPKQNIREKALTLLFHPPVSDEIGYYRRLVAEVLGNVPKIADLPPAFIEFLCEFIGFLGEIPGIDCLHNNFHRVIKNLPRSSLVKLFDKSLPLQPILKYVPVRGLPWRKRKPDADFKRKWRLLRRFICAISTSVPAHELTFTDLKPLWCVQGAGCHGTRFASRGRWRLVGRSLLLSPVGASLPAGRTNEMSECKTSGKISHFSGLDDRVYFGGFAGGALRYLETLLQWQAKELASVREVAVAASRNTRRVVLSWHNASLAAAGGWAFENLAEQFPSPALWQVFKRAVDSRTQMLQKDRSAYQSNLYQILELWKERLVKPKVAHALWESRVKASFDPAWREVYNEHIRTAGFILDEDAIREIAGGAQYGWYGAVNPGQRMNMDQILNWAGSREQIWQEGLIRLTAVLQEGQRLVTRGDLPHLVLPWIDKFFISSRRAKDLEYLPCLVRWLDEQGTPPLILFWEDTSHAQAPSFQLALANLAARVAFRGVGIFDWLGSDRSEALQLICREHGSVRLFALRPCSDDHYPRSFLQLIQNRDYRFFAHYDSSWKDNLCFLYVGTQVHPLLSVQCDMEVFPTWVGVERRKHPFGAYFRGRLREMVLDVKSDTADELSWRYAHWANLC